MATDAKNSNVLEGVCMALHTDENDNNGDDNACKNKALVEGGNDDTNPLARYNKVDDKDDRLQTTSALVQQGNIILRTSVTAR